MGNVDFRPLLKQIFIRPLPDFVTLPNNIALKTLISSHAAPPPITMVVKNVVYGIRLIIFPQNKNKKHGYIKNAILAGISLRG